MNVEEQNFDRRKPLALKGYLVHFQREEDKVQYRNAMISSWHFLFLTYGAILFKLVVAIFDIISVHRAKLHCYVNEKALKNDIKKDEVHYKVYTPAAMEKLPEKGKYTDLTNNLYLVSWLIVVQCLVEFAARIHNRIVMKSTTETADVVRVRYVY